MTTEELVLESMALVEQSDREFEEMQLAFQLDDFDAYIKRKVDETNDRLNRRYEELRAANSGGSDSGEDSGGISDSVDAETNSDSGHVDRPV